MAGQNKKKGSQEYWRYHRYHIEYEWLVAWHCKYWKMSPAVFSMYRAWWTPDSLGMSGYMPHAPRRMFALRSQFVAWCLVPTITTLCCPARGHAKLFFMIGVQEAKHRRVDHSHILHFVAILLNSILLYTSSTAQGGGGSFRIGTL